MTNEKKDKAPEIPLHHNVMLAIEALVHDIEFGRSIREYMRNNDCKLTDAGFYLQMKRMEESKLVKSKKEKKPSDVHDSRMVKETKYELTVNGLHAYNDTLAYWSERLGKRVISTDGGLAYE